MVIFDGKRNDILSFVKGYLNVYFGEIFVFGKKIRFFEFDVIIINFYFG